MTARRVLFVLSPFAPLLMAPSGTCNGGVKYGDTGYDTAALASCDATDADGDGVSVCDGDCNDANEVVYPAATEICNGVDDDCDGYSDDTDAATECFMGVEGARGAWTCKSVFMCDTLGVPGLAVNPASTCDRSGYYSTMAACDAYYAGAVTEIKTVSNGF